MVLMSPCRDGINWEPLDGGALWLANGQQFEHEITVVDPFPEGTTSHIEIDDVIGHFADGVLSGDRKTFAYSVDPPGSDDTEVADRARYRIWLLEPKEGGGFKPWKWYVGEVRRKDQ